jgi:hypothetical protein
MRRPALPLVPVLLIAAFAYRPVPRERGGRSPEPEPPRADRSAFWVSCPAADSCMAVGTYVKPSGATVN